MLFPRKWIYISKCPCGHLPATLMLTGFLHPLVGVGTKAIGSKVDGLGRINAKLSQLLGVGSRINRLVLLCSRYRLVSSSMATWYRLCQG